MASLHEPDETKADSNSVHRNHATFFFIFALIVLMTVALHRQGIGTASIWFDEAWSAFAANQPTLIDAFNADATNPPLYYGLLHVTARLWGDSAFGLRITSLFLGLIALALAAQLARRLGGSGAALLVMIFGALSAPLTWAAQEARMYTLLAVGVAACALAWEHLWTRPSRRAWLTLWIAELALLYTHNTGPVIALWLNVVMLLAWALRPGKRPAPLTWIAGQIAVALLYAPYFVTRFLLLSEANSAVRAVDSLHLSQILAVIQTIWIPPTGIKYAYPDILALVILDYLLTPLLFIAWIAIIIVIRRARWLALHGLILAVGLILALFILGTTLHGRYIIMLIPLVLAGFAVALNRLPRAARWIGAFVVIAPYIVLLLSGSIPAEFRNDDVRGTVQGYADRLTADDTVLAWSYADRYDLAYYWDRLGVTAQRVTLPEGADYAAIAPSIPTTGRVALNVWYTQRADYRGMMGCALEHGQRTPPESVTTAGMTSLFYPAAPSPLQPLQAVSARFTASDGAPRATLTGIGPADGLPADAALCLPIALTLDGDSLGDLMAVVTARHPVGGEIARVNTPLASANQRTPAALSAGETVTAWPLLRLPEGAPAGDYDLYLEVYDPDRQIALEPPRSADHPTIGRALFIGTWQAAAPSWVAPSSESAVWTDGARSILSVSADPAPGDAVRGGDALTVTVLWTGDGANSAALTLSDDAGRWRVTSSVPVGPIAGALRQWHRFTLPADAPDGAAVLRVAGRAIARWTVRSAPYATTVPPTAIALDAPFGDFAALVGANVPESVVYGEAFPVELVWRANGASEVSYVVFVQAIDSAGQVAAQSDAIPGGERVTTGWRAGEIVADGHMLRWNRPPAPGDLTLIAGLYDPLTGARVPVGQGDSVVVRAGVRASAAP